MSKARDTMAVMVLKDQNLLPPFISHVSNLNFYLYARTFALEVVVNMTCKFDYVLNS